ncbi:hypothetical protein HYU09_02540 [Candidatus Woesearchaeota archaeon]|nr:hypothetical protein [Candidatus Woesearchaeota archaeon]
MNKPKRKKLVLVAAVSIVIVILVAAVLLKISKKGGIEVAELEIKEITGNTVEERLAMHADISNAKITRITNASDLKMRYSAIFKDAEDGDYIAELPDRLLVYDFEHDEIIAEFGIQSIDLGEIGG